MVCLILTLFFCAACSGGQPYQQYQQAYQQLGEEDCFVTERSETVIYTENLFGTVEVRNAGYQETGQVMRDNNGTKFIANGVIISDEESNQFNSYYCDGYMYYQDIADPECNYRCRQDEDFVMKITTEGIIDFPQKVIAKQSAEDTADGLLLTFEMDSEKYYAYRFPQTTEEYEYGEFSVYREPPLYTVLLDSQGRIIQVTGQFCTVNSNYAASTEERSYTITFSQYREVVLDFPQLNEADYPEMQEKE